jgi:hypothetical protein
VSQFEYFRMRLRQEDERARKTMGTEAELLHRTMAAHYARLASDALTAAAGNDPEIVLVQSA